MTVLVLVAAGSRYETKKLNGVAHFAEHMFFKGTKKRPTALDISSEVDSIGGEFNAFTSKEFTGFYIKSSAEHIDLDLEVLSDMLLNSKFEQTEIDRERKVVSEELRMYLDNPMRHVGDVFEELLYGDQPLGWDTVGTLDSLKNINRRQFLEYVDHFYHPSNMLITIAGGVTVEAAKKIAEKYFGSLTDKKAASFLPVKFQQKSPAIKLHTKKTEQAHFILGVRSYPRASEHRYKLAVLNAILGTSMSSRLFIELRERRGLAYYVRSSVDDYKDAGAFQVASGVQPKAIEEAILVTLEQFKKISQQEVPEAELKKAKDYIKGKLVLELEGSQEVASTFGLQQLLENKTRTPEEVLREIDKVRTADLKKLAQDIFTDDKLNLAVIGPYKDEAKFAKILKI